MVLGSLLGRERGRQREREKKRAREREREEKREITKEKNADFFYLGSFWLNYNNLVNVHTLSSSQNVGHIIFTRW